jgi:hypothetical protein
LSFKEKRVMLRHRKAKGCDDKSQWEEADEELVSSQVAKASQPTFAGARKARLALLQDTHRGQVGIALWSYLDGSTLDDYLHICKGLDYVAVLFICIGSQRDSSWEQLRRQHSKILIENYCKSLFICSKLLAYFRIITPCSENLRMLPREVIFDLSSVSTCLACFAMLTDDSCGVTQHSAFSDATHNIWKMGRQRNGEKRARRAETENASDCLPAALKKMVKQLIWNHGGHLGDTCDGGVRYDWHVDEKGDAIMTKREMY